MDYQTRWEELRKKDVESARVSYPNDSKCHFCSKDNDWADDCGWFYIIDPREKEERNPYNNLLINKMYPACKSCYDKHSWKHIELYGLGER